METNQQNKAFKQYMYMVVGSLLRVN